MCQNCENSNQFIHPPALFSSGEMLQVYQKKKSQKKGRQSREMLTTCVAQSYIQTHARNQPSAAAVPHSKNHRPILLYLVVQRNIYVSQQHPPIFQKEKKKRAGVPTEEMEPPFSFTSKSPGPPFFFFLFRHPVELRPAGELWLLYKRNVPFSVVVTQSSFYSFWPFIDDFFYFWLTSSYSSFLAVRDTYILKNMRFYLRTKGEWSPPAFCIWRAWVWCNFICHTQ